MALGTLALRYAGTMLLAVTVVFVAMQVVGDPARAALGETATRAQVEAFRSQLGLDRPVYEQYVAYLGDLAQGDLGRSIQYRRPNAELILGRLPASIQLAVAAMLFGLALGLPLGLVAGFREGGLWDRITMAIALLGQAMPSYWIGMMFIVVFAVGFGLVPAAGSGTMRHLILPTVTLGIWPLAQVARLTRSTVSDILEEDYVLAARGRGSGAINVAVVHTLRNAALPILTLTGVQLGTMLSNAITIEVVFGWPGLGHLAANAVSSRDVTLVQALVVVGALAFVVINLTVDMLYGILDPRVRRRQRA